MNITISLVGTSIDVTRTQRKGLASLAVINHNLLGKLYVYFSKRKSTHLECTEPEEVDFLKEINPRILHIKTPFSTNKLKTLGLEPGMFVILGGTGSGKSTLVQELMNENQGEKKLVIHAEPLSHPAIDPQYDKDPVYTSAAEYLLAEFAKFLFSDEDILFIDSFREFNYMSGGGTGKGGTNMGLFAELTKLSNLAAQFGKHVIGVHNPLAVDPEIERFLLSNMESSMPGVIHLPEVGKAKVVMRGVLYPTREAHETTIRVDTGRSAPSHLVLELGNDKTLPFSYATFNTSRLK